MTGHWFEDLHDVVADDLRFKAKLAIGEDAYTSTRMKNAVFEAWDVAGVAATGAQVASSAFVAQKFFAAPGLLAAFGVGTAATPVGWVIAASVVTGGAWFGITRYLKGVGGQTQVIPEFINTPLDVLGLALFDLICPLALKVAAVDGKTDPSELAAIKTYLVKQWGYDADFVDAGMAFVSDKLHDYDIKAAGRALAAFARENPDCKAHVMLSDIKEMLREVMHADGVIDEREEMAIERIEKAFRDELSFSLARTVAPVGSAVSGAAGATVSTATSAASTAGNAVTGVGQVAARTVGGAVSKGSRLLRRALRNKPAKSPDSASNSE